MSRCCYHIDGPPASRLHWRKAVRTVYRHGTFYDLLEALAQPGCAICTLVARTRWRYLDSLAYENVNDPGVRARIRAALGFCNRHAWYFVETVREVFGAAIIYRDILHTVQRAVARGAGSRAIEPAGPCPACEAERQAAEDALTVLTEAFDDPDLHRAFERSDGLCGPHLLQVAATGRTDERRRLVAASLEHQQGNGMTPPQARWRAVGAPGLFPTDEQALTSGESDRVAAPSVELADPFTCPVCTAVRSDLDRIASWESLDNQIGGLCNVHAWMPPGQDCLKLYTRQITTMAQRARELAEAGGKAWLPRAVRELRQRHSRADDMSFPLSCIACRRQAAIERSLCTLIVRPLCLPHLRRAVRQNGPEAMAAVRSSWRDLDHLLGEYLRKEDYRFRGEPRGIEQKSPRWIVALISGAPGIR